MSYFKKNWNRKQCEILIFQSNNIIYTTSCIQQPISYIHNTFLLDAGWSRDASHVTRATSRVSIRVSAGLVGRLGLSSNTVTIS